MKPNPKKILTTKEKCNIVNSEKGNENRRVRLGII